MATCKCGNPPGGGGRCPNGHIAICRSDGVNCQTTCIEPSDALAEMIRNRTILESPEESALLMANTLASTFSIDPNEIHFRKGRGRQVLGIAVLNDGSTLRFSFPGLKRGTLKRNSISKKLVWHQKE